MLALPNSLPILFIPVPSNANGASAALFVICPGKKDL